MKQSHTPAPWQYAKALNSRPYEKFDIFHESAPNYNNSYGVNTGNKKTFIAVIKTQPAITTYEANARLISAAPELLAACESALDTIIFDDAPGVYNKIRNAINKARGDL